MSDVSNGGIVQRSASKASLIRKLRATRDRIERLDMQLQVARRDRDDLALELIENHELTWRETAGLAGFENPYIARILRRARSAY